MSSFKSLLRQAAVKRYISTIDNPMKLPWPVKKKERPSNAPPIVEAACPEEYLPRKLVEKEKRMLKIQKIEEEKKVILLKAQGKYMEEAAPSTIRQSKIETDVYNHILHIIEKECDEKSLLKSPVWRITKIAITKDLKYARIFWILSKLIHHSLTVEQIDIILQKHYNFLRYHLQKKMNMKFAPQLMFVYDRQVPLDEFNEIKRIHDIQ